MGRLDPAVADVRRAVRVGLEDLAPGAPVVVACSGGADSLALAAAVVFEARRAGWAVSGAIVDHSLQSYSAEVADRVVRQLSDLGCESAAVLQVSVVSDGSGPEAAARSARYAALEAEADRLGASVLLGHTRDDQAETVLLGLARGSGVRSLAGMSTSRPPFRRPLLTVPRSSTRRMCEALGLEPWPDPHNEDPRYARVRVRQRVLPVLEHELGPGIAEALARTASMARQDADALDVHAADLYSRVCAAAGDPVGQSLDLEAMLSSLPALRRRVIKLALLKAGSPAGDLSAAHIEAVDQLITHWHGQSGVDLPGHVRASRCGELLTFERRQM